jgi:hypothetical protein
MRKRTLLLSLTVACVAAAAAFGWVTIRRGFSARDNPSAIETLICDDRTPTGCSIVRSQYRQLTFAPKNHDRIDSCRRLVTHYVVYAHWAEVMKPLRTPVLAGMSALCCMC